MTTTPTTAPAIEGTIVFDGLLEGPLPLDESTQSQLRSWAQRGLAGIVPLRLQLDGDRFSILPDNRPIPIARFRLAPGLTLASTLRRDLDTLAALCPPARRPLASTLRSIETHPGEQTQTLYTLLDNRFDVHERIVPAATQRAPKPRLLLKSILLALILAALAAGHLYFDYTKLLREYATTIDASTAILDTAPLQDVVRIEQVEVAPDRDALLLHLKAAGPVPSSAIVTVTDSNGTVLHHDRHDLIPVARLGRALLRIPIPAPLLSTTRIARITLHSAPPPAID